MSERETSEADQMVTFTPIGIIHTPFSDVQGTPIQPAGAADVRGWIEIKPELAAGLDGLAGFSHVMLLYHFHRVRTYALKVKPFLDDQERGVFATRAPKRPNPIGLSVVRLLSIDGCRLTIQGVDVLDGTPLLDIKPFVPQMDSPQVDRIGWLAGRVDRLEQMRADDRFRDQ